MRTKSIISIIRKYGLSSKRLSNKNKVKYADAIKALKAYGSADLEIDRVIDNTREHTHCNCHCQVEGCGQKIRYEYILRQKATDKNIIAGSTCVWPMLGLSELESKDFMRYDQVIREHYLLNDWMDANADVVDRLNRLKDADAYYFRPFWEEIETSRLTDEDTEYIRSLDIDKEVEKALYAKEMKKVSADEYRRAIAYLPELVEYSKGDAFIASLNNQVRNGRKLSGNQYRWLKVSINRMWYGKNIKGTNRDILSNCEDYLTDVFEQVGYNGSTTDFNMIDMVEEFVKMSGNATKKLAWNLFKIKKAIVH